VELLFQDVLNGYLQTLAVSTRCSRALVYLQSDKEKVLQVVCRFPVDERHEGQEEEAPTADFLPVEYIHNFTSPKMLMSAGPSTLMEYPIIFADSSASKAEAPDYYGLLRVEYASSANVDIAQADAVGSSIARSIALSIKLEYMHFEHCCKLEAEVEAREHNEEAKYTNALIDGIWTTASNSIKTMRTMLKMLERRNVGEGDEIGRETYDNIHVQLETLGMSISPLMPSVYRTSVDMIDEADGKPRGTGGLVSSNSSSLTRTVSGDEVWTSADKEETQISYNDD